MKSFKILFFTFLIIELSAAKRSFGITSRRSKSKSVSVRRGQHSYDNDDHHVPLPKPIPPDAKKNVGWNTHQSHHTPSAPAGAANQGNLYAGNNHQMGHVSRSNLTNFKNLKF